MESRADILKWLKQKLTELGHPQNSVTLLAVSKLQSVEKIIAMHKEGQIDFGENYVQEALMKMAELKTYKIHWHLIGHLQKNKVNQAVGSFDLIHSIDSIELLEKVNSRAAELKIMQNVLVQINQAAEKKKTGFQPEQFPTQWDHIKSFKNVKICGLMCLPPLFENPEMSRPYFRNLKKLLEEIKSKTDLEQHPLSHLSMGTSHDFQVAIEEGTTILRIGTLLFGERIVQAKGKL